MKNQKGFAIWIVFIIVLTVAISGIVAYYLVNQKQFSESPIPGLSALTAKKYDSRIQREENKIGQQLKTPHFVDASPKNSEVFAASPYNIVINFDFDLFEGSEIVVEKDGVDYGYRETRIEEDKLTLRREVKQNLQDGIYQVKYKACWPDGSCHDGVFFFQIDSNKLSEYQDFRGKNEVAVIVRDLEFKPAKILINKDTKVIWVNEDQQAHYINSDPHPGHNFYEDINSRLLQIGDSYSTIFYNVGEYPYHCSTHPTNMLGRILVVN